MNNLFDIHKPADHAHRFGLRVPLNVPSDLTGTLTLNASAMPITLSIPCRKAQRTFAGARGQQVTVRMTSNSIGAVSIRLFRPNGTQQVSTSSAAGSFNLSTQTLASTGTYRVEIDPTGANTGSISVRVTNP
jgi:hypothetical protein